MQAALAGACANLHSLPERLNPVVRPLMESIKKEASEELQAHSADTLAELLAQLVDRDPCPNNKVLVNLKAFLRYVNIFLVSAYVQYIIAIIEVIENLWPLKEYYSYLTVLKNEFCR